MIDLVFGFHLYQPPNQDPDVLEKITGESYSPVIDLILSHPKARFTADIAKSAIEQLEKSESGSRFIENLKMSLGLKKISLVNTAAYHPIMPLIPKREIVRQSLLNEECYKHLLGDSYQKPDGFFPPEMAFSPKLPPILEELGYQWTITADTPFVAYYNHEPDPPFDWIPKQKNIGIFLRSDFWSHKVAFDHISGKIFANSLKQEMEKWFKGQRGYLIIWLDWETFGHHRKSFIKNFLAQFLDSLSNEINLCSAEELLSSYPKKEILVPPGSWSTNLQDFWYKNYWPLWRNPHIEFHQLWWELAKIVLEIKKNVESEDRLAVFDKALYSCQTWQCSYGNKSLAIGGMAYFKEIIDLEEAKDQRENAKKIIEKMENI